jgi:hypothetical protein
MVELQIDCNPPLAPPKRGKRAASYRASEVSKSFSRLQNPPLTPPKRGKRAVSNIAKESKVRLQGKKPTPDPSQEGKANGKLSCK